MYKTEALNSVITMVVRRPIDIMGGYRFFYKL